MNDLRISNAIHNISDIIRAAGLTPESTILALAALCAWSQFSSAIATEAGAPGFWGVDDELDEDHWRAVIACLKSKVRERAEDAPVGELDTLTMLPISTVIASWHAARSAMLQDPNNQTRWRDFAIELLFLSPSWMGGADDPAVIATVLEAALEVAPHSAIYCFGDASAALAIHWGRRSHDVSIDVSNWRFALLVALLAIGANAPLSVGVYNSGDASPRKTLCDRVVIAPPFNAAIWGKPSERMPWAVDARIYDRLIDPAVKWAAVIVPDGFLFRTTSSEQALKQRLIEEFGLSAVISLRKGVFATTIGTALLVHALHQDRRDGILFVDGRLVQDDKSELKIQNVLKSRADTDISRLVPNDELERNAFNFLVERYVRPFGPNEYAYLLDKYMTDSLDEFAEFSRSPVISASKNADGDQAIFEVTNSDIQDSVVRQPKKKVMVDRQTYAKCKRAFLSPGDILFSVKGRLGVIGLVTEEALADAEGPWIAGQSFVTLKLRASFYRSPAVLAAYLSSPMMQEDIRARSVGATVPSIQIADVKKLEVPILSEDNHRRILAALSELDSLRRQRNEIEQTIADKLKHFWPSVLL